VKVGKPKGDCENYLLFNGFDKMGALIEVINGEYWSKIT